MPDWLYFPLALLVLAGGFGLAWALVHLLSCWQVMKELDRIQKGDKHG